MVCCNLNLEIFEFFEKYWLIVKMIALSIVREILLMEAARTSETSDNVYQTSYRNISGQSHHACCSENFKSHLVHFYN
jgi:hypothetical protein